MIKLASSSTTMHVLPWAEYIPSPNYNERPDASDISLIVIHNISLPPKQFGGDDVIKFFTNTLDHSTHPYYQEIAHLYVSSHLFIRRDGSVVQFVPFNCRAWHAGNSCYEQRINCNDYSIGIELEGADDIAYDESQYDALVKVVCHLLKEYPHLSSRRITGHEHISPGRKTDPGDAFNWAKLVAAIDAQGSE